ncbi:hypothetical protein C2S51_014781 [Perilla frutescens var. frutescens]|nr:hypothetical protein C2S51_014781 [Perilla frutescens var. frutescens]
MSYSILVSLEKTIVQILDHGIYSISAYEKKQILSVDKYAISFQAFLEDFPQKAKNLEARIRDVAMEAEDIIDWFMIEQIWYNFRYTKWIAELRRIKFKYQLQKVIYEMDSIAAEMVEMKNSFIVKEAQLIDSLGADSSSSSSQVADTGKVDVVGLNGDLIEIKSRLCEDSPQLRFLPILGMGGIGKTTLARNAYDDLLIMEHFHIRAWVTISQDYSERRTLSGLLDCMKEFDPEQRNESMADLAEIPQLSDVEMVDKVYKTLVGRRFLIVMDDIWSTEVLDDVKNLFPDNNNGSRIMLTTRLTDVAAYADSCTPFHEMRLMDADQSWNLLQQKISAHQDHIPREWESSGREIVRSCGGLPLAIVVVAGLIYKLSKDLTSWEEILRNVKSYLATTDGQIEKILSLSYSHLPHHLRPCFLYMGGFPENHEINVTDLVRLWIAEGFVESTGSKSHEDRAEEYLEDLINRSLIVVTKRKSNGKIKYCSLHDMVRELCIKLSHQERFLVHITTGRGRQALRLLKGMEDQRRISIYHSDLKCLANIFSSTIRTVMYFQDTLGSFGSFRLLRVLDVLRVRFKSRLVPDQFFELFHLRYLAFCYDEHIPRAISNLQNLQTLVVKTSLYRPLPCEIWNMPQLRHLIISGCWLVIPNGSTLALENLQTLRKLKNLTCSMTVLSMVPNLKKLCITYFRRSGDLLFHNLVHLRQLEKLQLELETDWPDPGDSNLFVPTSLKKLTLIGWGCYKPYINVFGPLPNLEVLKLIKFNFLKRQWTTTDGDFPQLKFLLLHGSDLVDWNIESCHFPRLKALLIHASLCMHEIPTDIGEIPTLELIELKLCTKSLADSAIRIQEEQQSYGGDAFEVRCIDCGDNGRLKKHEFIQFSDSVRKGKKVRQKRPRLRRMRVISMAAIPYSTRDREVLDVEEAELKIVDYKAAELQL